MPPIQNPHNVTVHNHKIAQALRQGNYTRLAYHLLDWSERCAPLKLNIGNEMLRCVSINLAKRIQDSPVVNEWTP